LQADFIDGIRLDLSGDGAGKGTGCSNREIETPEKEREGVYSEEHSRNGREV